MVKLFLSVLFILLFYISAEAYDFSNPNVSGDTVAHLNEIFADAADNRTCSNLSDVVAFPNYTGLEGCVRKYFQNNRWPLSCSMALDVIHLECNDPNISSLDGLQQFPNIETLSFSDKGTNIEDLSPIRNLQKLKVLSIPNSKISDMAFLSALKNLETLNLSGNSVTDIQYLAYLIKLENLSLEYQGPDYINDIGPIRFLSVLRNLSLQGNKITDISPLREALSLQTLNIRDNRIGSLEPISNLSKLSWINASINMISDISPIGSLFNLSSVTINSNRLGSIDALTGLNGLNYVSLIGNDIKDISPIADKRNIRSISLDYNNINDLSPIHDIMLYANVNELGIAYNCVPEENYESIKYLKDISRLRLEHQCEPYDAKDAVPDIASVVNGDLVGAQDLGIGEGSSSDSAGRGCSASLSSKGSYIDIIYAFCMAAFFIKYLRNRKKSI